ncbi:MAG: regulating kinase and related kinase [Archaeoglobi archaeon]|nr:regulating kinase and related kinase [Archaeoglobi archaeon]MDK2782298.1 regulating kinase and related kinase [Archaeoglobi archaeon]
MEIISHCAEAIILRDGENIIKRRIPKRYRIKELDELIRRRRTKSEAKLMVEARKAGVPTPIIRDIRDFEIVMEYIEGRPLKEVLSKELVRKAGELVARLHENNIIHGDLTTSNMIVRGERLYLIDFGLGYFDEDVESKAVDIHVFFQTLESTEINAEELKKCFIEGYRRYSGWMEVLEREKEIRKRVRYA